VENRANVYFDDFLAGELSQDRYGTICFQYHREYVGNGHRPISISMPVCNEIYYGNEAHAYFTGLLPEEDVLTATANIIGTSRLNYFKLLTELGKEPIGAIKIGDNMLTEPPSYEEISIEELNNIILRNEPLLGTLYKEKELRLSLAGAQSKTGLFYSDRQYYVPKNGSPSNIIVKHTNNNFPDLVYNEYACMKIANAIGINTPNIRLESTSTQPLYIIERYDRNFRDKFVQRIHQEDFCQSLGIMSQNKYEADGGPSFAACIGLLRKSATVPVVEINRFISLFLFNLIVGNKDAHGKNYSIIFDKSKKELSPAYDILSTTYYPMLSEKMSMSINGKFELDEINEGDLYQMSQAANIGGKLIIKEYHRIKDLLLPTAKKVLNASVFPEAFRIDFYNHLQKTHSQLLF
jgi:serine/threonine-protein kinase HipA